MLIGVDLDNTLIDYGDLFYRQALNRGLLGTECPKDKQSVRNALRAKGKDEDFTRIQGEVYGPLILQASSYPGARDVLAALAAQGHQISIISHKTRFPYLGEKHDLHASARQWLLENGFTAIPGIEIFLELSLKEKLGRIKSEKCHVFIDDLPEFLIHPDFPNGVERVLFSPDSAISKGEASAAGIKICSCWDGMEAVILRNE